MSRTVNRSRYGGMSRRVAVVLVSGALLLGAGGVAVLPNAVADSIDDQKAGVDQQIADLKDSLEGANADFVEAAVALKQTQLKLAAAQAALAQAKKDLAAAAAKDAKLAAQLAFAQAEEDKAQRSLDAQTAAEAQTRQMLGQIARQAYTGAGMNGLSLVLEADSPDQFTQRLAVAGAALRVQNSAIDKLAVQKAEMRARDAKLEAVRAQVEELKRQSAIVVAQRKAAQDAAAAAEAEVATLVAQQQKAVDDIQTKIEAEKKRLEELEAEQGKLKAILLARAKAAEEARRRANQGSGGSGNGGGGSGGGAPSNSGGYLSYAANGPITSGYGMRYHPILHIYRMHTGIDFGIDCGTPVYATADGDVVQAGWAGGYGNRIVIDHGLVRGVDLATTYNHLQRIVVGGGRVERGQLIGYSGTTGLSTGCHLHFETLVNGDFTNPMNWL